MGEKNKFIMGEEKESKAIPEILSPSTTTTTTTTIATTQHKKPLRHHVKKRSSGRVHVTKLAPMTRSNSTNFIDTEANSNEENEKPAMRRSQSNRSLHKMSDRRGFTAMTPRRKSTASSEKIAASQVVSSLPTPSSSTTKQPETKLSSSPVNPVSLSSTVIAAPVEQTFNAVAKNLIVPKTSDYSKIVSPPKVDPNLPAKKQPLRSQFLSEETFASSQEQTVHKSNSASTTQQKLMLKKQALSEDENSPSHLRNMSKLNNVLDAVCLEYRSIKRYQDPMLESLLRCLKKLDIDKNLQITRLQLGANQHSISTALVPSVNNVTKLSTASHIPHLEQRQMAHRHHHLKAVALSRAQKQQSQSSISSSTSNQENGLFTAFPWNATNLLDKLFSSNSAEN